MTIVSPVTADAADRLILDEAADLMAGVSPAEVVAIGSPALNVGARYFSDLLDPAATAEGLDETLLAGARVVLVRLPGSLDALDRIARAIARFAAPDVVVVAGGRLKYMTHAMNEVLTTSFGRLDVSLARQKSRVLIARSPRDVAEQQPHTAYVPEVDLTVAAYGSAFAGAALDIGTRAMLDTFDDLPDYAVAVDLGSGTGILAAELKRRRAGARVIASDASADAVDSARQTLAGLGVEVVRDRGLSTQPDRSADLIVLNPPFHDRGAMTTSTAQELFAEAARVLRPGGELRVVWNSHLAYRDDLERVVGPTRQVARTPKFTVTASTVSDDFPPSTEPNAQNQ